MYRESVRTEFLLASLNDLEIFACNIGNVHLNTKCREKFLAEVGIEFGTEKGMVMIIEIEMIIGHIIHGQIGLKLKGEECNSKDKKAHKGSKINTDLIGYVTKIFVKISN